MGSYILSIIRWAVLRYGLFYLAAVSLVSAGVTVYDKRRARSHGRRVPERTLVWLSVFGGSAAMYITMRLIRHKTRHMKFMAGIPVIMAAQAAAIAALFYWKA